MFSLLLEVSDAIYAVHQNRKPPTKNVLQDRDRRHHQNVNQEDQGIAVRACRVRRACVLLVIAIARRTRVRRAGVLLAIAIAIVHGRGFRAIRAQRRIRHRTVGSLADAGVGSDEKGRQARVGGDDRRAAHVEDSVQDAADRRGVFGRDPQGRGGETDLLDKERILRVRDAHELVDVVHVGHTGVGGEAVRRAAQQGAEKLVKVRQQAVGVAGGIGIGEIGSAVQEVQSHSFAAAIRGGSGAIEERGEAPFLCEDTGDTHVGITQNSEVDDRCHERLLVVRRVVCEQCRRVLVADGVLRLRDRGQQEKGGKGRELHGWE